VDTTGSIYLADGKHDFDGELELSNILAGSDQVNHCMVQQWFRFAFGRLELPEDERALALANDAFSKSGYDLRQIVRAFLQSDTFRFRRRTSTAVSP
jgi:hypothetical protein